MDIMKRLCEGRNSRIMTGFCINATNSKVLLCLIYIQPWYHLFKEKEGVSINAITRKTSDSAEESSFFTKGIGFEIECLSSNNFKLGTGLLNSRYGGFKPPLQNLFGFSFIVA